MYHHIVVPLDGSANAEQALAPAYHIAEASNARVSLIRVAEPGDTEADVRTYLGGVAAKVKPHAFALDLEVLRGSAAAAILRYCTDHDVDLIVSASHGAQGDVRFVLGSVAWKLLQAAPCPLLVIPIHSPRALAAG